MPTGWKFFGNLMDAGLCSVCGEESFGTGIKLSKFYRNIECFVDRRLFVPSICSHLVSVNQQHPPVDIFYQTIVLKSKYSQQIA